MGKVHFLGLILNLFPVFVLAQSASDKYSDSQIKDTHIKMEVQRKKLDRDLAPTESIDENSTFVPSGNSSFDVTPTQWGEQEEALRTETAVPISEQDPSKDIENEVYRRQQYERHRKNYRNAIQRQFNDNLESAGVKVRRNIADEIEALENARKGSAR